MSVIDQPLTSAPSGTSFVTKILRFRELAIVVAIALVFVLTYFKNPSFASTASVQQMLSGPSIIIMLAVGETLVIVTRNVDLSIGSVLGLSALSGRGSLRAFPAHAGGRGTVGRTAYWTGVRCGQRRNRGLRSGARLGGDSGHALHHSGYRRDHGQRGADSAQPDSAIVRESWCGNDPGHSVLVLHRRGAWWPWWDT